MAQLGTRIPNERQCVFANTEEMVKSEELRPRGGVIQSRREHAYMRIIMSSIRGFSVTISDSRDG
jgi:hypothetical protein